MMKNSKKILITSESREIFIVRMNGKETVRGFCEICAAETEMLMLDQAVSLFGIGTLEIIRHIKTGEIHSKEIASLHLLVCQNSFGEFIEGEMK
jgi:hypothetical protein